jgi:hypothetical protein
MNIPITSYRDDTQTINVVCGLLHAHLKNFMDIEIVMRVCAQSELGPNGLEIWKTFRRALRLREMDFEYFCTLDERNQVAIRELANALRIYEVRYPIVRRCLDKYATGSVLSRRYIEGRDFDQVFEVLVPYGIYKFVIRNNSAIRIFNSNRHFYPYLFVPKKYKYTSGFTRTDGWW